MRDHAMRDAIHTASAGRYRETGIKRALFETLPIIRVWHERARQRRALGRLDDHLLRDIGLNRAEAILESRKPFWRA